MCTSRVSGKFHHLFIWIEVQLLPVPINHGIASIAISIQSMLCYAADLHAFLGILKMVPSEIIPMFFVLILEDFTTNSLKNSTNDSPML